MHPSSPLNPAVQELLTTSIDSVVQLDLLLLLRRDPARAWIAKALAAELRAPEARIQALAQELIARGLAKRTDAGFQYAAEAALDEAVAALAAAYQRYPVAVVTFIYNKPNRSLQSFADAFRLRPPPPPPASTPPPPTGESNG